MYNLKCKIFYGITVNVFENEISNEKKFYFFLFMICRTLFFNSHIVEIIAEEI